MLHLFIGWPLIVIGLALSAMAVRAWFSPDGYLPATNLTALLLGIVLLVAGVVVVAVPVFAAEAPPDAAAVTVPWGNWLDAFIVQIVLPILATVLLAILAWAAKFLPASLRAYATTKNTAAVEQLLQRAITFGLNMIQGAAAGQTLSVPLGSAVLATSAQYAIDHGPAWLLQVMGGEQGVREKILARLPIEAGADGGEVLAKAAPAIG